MAGRKKLFKTYLTEHLSISKREDDIQLIDFINLNVENIVSHEDMGKMILCAEDISKKSFRNYYKIIGFERLDNGKEIFHVIGIEKNYRSFYKESLAKIPDNLVDKRLVDKFLSHQDQYKKYKKNRKG